MPGIDYRQLRADITMAEVLELLGFVVVERRGHQVRGQCPFHEPCARGKRRSFSVNLRRHLFQCFKCQAAGNQLDLWARATKKPIHEAALDLCARLHKEVPHLNKATGGGDHHERSAAAGDRATPAERDVGPGHRQGIGHLAQRRAAVAGPRAGPAGWHSTLGNKPRARRPSIIDPFEPILKELLDQVSEPHHRACPAGTASPRLHRQVHGRASTPAVVAAADRAGRRCRALRPAQVSRRKWTMASMTSTSRAKAGAAFICSATCSATHAGSICALSNRWICRQPCATTCMPSIISAAWPASACTTTSRPSSCVTMPTAPSTIPSSWPSPPTTASVRRPAACAGHKPRAKSNGSFFYVETSLLNGRTFDTLEHLNEVTAWWLQSVADVRVLRDFKETPLQRHQREQPHLLAAADLRLRHRPGRLSPRQRRRLHHASAQSLLRPLLAHRPGAARAHHGDAKSSSTRSAWRKSPAIRSCPARRPACGRRSRAIIRSTIPASVTQLLRQRFGELGPVAVQFLDGLLGQAGPGQTASPATPGPDRPVPA